MNPGYSKNTYEKKSYIYIFTCRHINYVPYVYCLIDAYCRLSYEPHLQDAAQRTAAEPRRSEVPARLPLSSAIRSGCSASDGSRDANRKPGPISSVRSSLDVRTASRRDPRPDPVAVCRRTARSTSTILTSRRRSDVGLAVRLVYPERARGESFVIRIGSSSSATETVCGFGGLGRLFRRTCHRHRHRNRFDAASDCDDIREFFRRPPKRSAPTKTLTSSSQSSERNNGTHPNHHRHLSESSSLIILNPEILRSMSFSHCGPCRQATRNVR